MTNVHHKFSVLAIIVLFLLAFSARAQTAAGTVTGVVADASGAVIPGAHILLENRGTGAQRTATSNSSGAFRINAVPQGQYHLVAQAPGFKTGTVDFKLDVAGQQALKIALQVGQRTQTVQVSGAIERVDTQDATLSSVVNERQVVDLPLNGRDVFALEALQPGIVNASTALIANFIPYDNTVAGLLPAGGSATFAFNTAGHPPQSNDYTLDGVANNSPIYGGQPGVTPSVDNVQEFRLLETNFSAQYGRNSGAVVNVATKSGTNVAHGTAYFFLRNNIFDARTYFDPPKIAPLRQTQSGGTVGGPIVKNRTFFFFGFEALHSFKGSSSIGTFETPEFRALVHSLHPGSGPDLLLQKYPGPPITPGTAVDLGSPSTAYATPGPKDGIPDVGLATYVTNSLNTSHQFNVRIDQNVTANNQLFGRYTWGPAKISPVDPRGASIGLGETGSQGQGVISDTQVISQKLVNEFHYGYTRNGVFDTQKDFNVPTTTVSANIGGDTIAGFASDGVQATTLGAEYSISDTLSYNLGNHALKFGYEHHWDQDNGNRWTTTYGSIGYRGIFDFASNYADSSAVRIDPAQVGGTPTPVGTPDDYRQQDNGVFVQDTWKVTPRFVLDYGMRWDRYGPATEIRDRIGEPVLGPGRDLFEQTMNAVNKRVPYVYKPGNQWAPRFGFAWDVFGDGKTSVRGGYAVAFDRLQFLAFRGGIRFNPPDSASLTLNTRSVAAPLGLSQTQMATILGNTLTIPYTLPPGTTSQGFNPGGGPILALTINGKTVIFNAPISVASYQSHFIPPYSQNFFLSFQHEIAPALTMELAYIGNVGRHEEITNSYNNFNGDVFGIPNPYTGAYAGDTSVNLLNPYFSSDLYGSFGGYSSYNGGYISVNKRFTRGFSFQSAYTYGHAIDNIPTGRVDNNAGLPDAHYPDLNRGTSGYDVTHRWVSNFIYELPFFHDQHRLAGEVLGGWQLQGIIQLQSGTPYTVLTSNANYDFNGDGKGQDRLDAPVGGFAKYNHISRKQYINGVFGSSAPIGTNTLNLPTTLRQAQAVFLPLGLQPTGACYYPGKTGAVRQLAGSPCFSEGNVGRNTFRGPGSQTVDASLFKNFPVPWFSTQQARFQLRAEVFNVLNRTNLQQVTNSWDSATFGRSTSAFDAREFQFAGKFIF